ncbi:ABC-type lipoprotein export system, ATPase component [Thomasclavelia cocleata]|uniref:ABC-type lipoprotein export system, ATPase component n=2 Tax=Thomasclavelia cocleata TaxID=69824 RepID=A0A1I0D9L7_9FIRM|nr:ABC transporter ATP-binding protein/permease [Thomasclavelia cocleata]MCR1960415.1 ATP-binding cassette domain-containing protein [Thomasclavelia cocleata]NDO41953.1 ABC transporter ATP-binding protein/permease [Thomasclavelia cocleata]SET28973.1 ABC-type lipoprotein export system, ATPase component [Thomasclavelia cocleata]
MLQIQKIKKEYIIGNLHQTALNGITLNLRDNEFVAILGPSGSGKTTLLNIIGGLDHYDSGDLIINGISTKKYKDRDWDSYRNHTIGFVFQSYNLIPHQTVLANVELALTISGISKSERRKRAIDALKQVGLEKHVYKRPNQMSGGQMQRVAIARALVNDPDILLADEPTGALDSDTSVQVMELLKKVAKDRLVVMVTHNPELAQKYANRIVKVRDGNIVDDTNPFKINVSNQSFAEHKNMGKASMSWLTSLSLSFNNLKTKKARTILTSFAGSIGIIGIALILSLSNGVNQYIQSIEEETLSEYPLQIQSTGFDITSIITDVHSNQDKDEKDDTKIYVSQMITNMFSKIGSNDLTSLKDYLDSGKSDIKKYTNAIEYNYNIAPQIYTINSENIRQVNPDKSFSSLGLGSSTNSNSLISSMMSTDVFYPMPSNLDLYKDQYDIKAGNWPKSYNECVVVLSKNGNINDFMLYTLGLRDYSELDKMIEQFSKEESVEIPDNSTSYSYKDILGIEFKLVNAVDYYQYDSNYNVYKDKKDDQNYMKNLIENGENIKIVGIVQPKDSATATMLQSGIGYPAALTTHVIKQAASSEIIKKQLDNPNIDVFTGKDFNDRNKNQLDLNSLFTVDEGILKGAFTFDQSKLSMEDLDLSQIKLDSSILPTIDVNDIFSDMKINISQDNIESFTKAIITQFQEYLKENELIDPTKINEYFRAFLQTEQVQKLFQDEMIKIIQTSGLTEQFENQLQIVMAQYTDTISKSLQQQINVQMTKQMDNLAYSMQDAIKIDTSAFAKAIKMNMNEEELTELMMSLMTSEVSSYDGNLKSLGYVDFNKPTAINIYPKDFENKQNVINILDKYNNDIKNVDEDKVISYTDYVGTLMSSVTDIINVISYVLIAFVAISLIVSSIMIGVITYISVLERKKEIGILRAIGASKRNISQVFNAETFIIGLLAGVLGIVITLLLLIPGNALIHEIAGNTSVNAVLPIGGAFILIILSVILTMIGGLIPSKKAAQEDPVTALRSE